MEIISYALVTLDLPYIFYLFKIMRHYSGFFNQIKRCLQVSIRDEKYKVQ